MDMSSSFVQTKGISTLEANDYPNQQPRFEHDMDMSASYIQIGDSSLPQRRRTEEDMNGQAEISAQSTLDEDGAPISTYWQESTLEDPEPTSSYMSVSKNPAQQPRNQMDDYDYMEAYVQRDQDIQRPRNEIDYDDSNYVQKFSYNTNSKYEPELSSLTNVQTRPITDRMDEREQRISFAQNRLMQLAQQRRL